MKILVACEESQAVTIELRKLGHEAFSCDLLPCSGGHPEWHLHKSVFDVMHNNWDMMIAFPPCTDLAVSGSRWFPEKIKNGTQQKSIQFFIDLINAPIPKIAIENPIGIMSSKYRKPDQIIQPWQFGNKAQKSTCLWLKNLHKLEHTEIVEKGDFITMSNGKKMAKWYNDSALESMKIKCPVERKALRQKLRSKTFPGIARAMAIQWAGDINNKNK
jgi:hypothetical protein